MSLIVNSPVEGLRFLAKAQHKPCKIDFFYRYDITQVHQMASIKSDRFVQIHYFTL